MGYLVNSETGKLDNYNILMFFWNVLPDSTSGLCHRSSYISLENIFPVNLYIHSFNILLLCYKCKHYLIRAPYQEKCCDGCDSLMSLDLCFSFLYWFCYLLEYGFLSLRLSVEKIALDVCIWRECGFDDTIVIMRFVLVLAMFQKNEIVFLKNVLGCLSLAAFLFISLLPTRS